MSTSSSDAPRKVVIKMMTVKRGIDDVFGFFENIKNIKIGRAIKSVDKGEDGWWTFEHVMAGKSKIRSQTNKEFGILDHVFVGGGIEWNVYVRIVPNQSGSTTTWTFVRPDGLSDEDFESQLKGYDSEIDASIEPRIKSLLEDKDNLVAIDKYFDKLLTSLNTAVAIENKLDKEQTAFNDILDAFRLSLQLYQKE